jgi:predicted AlkP superfamily phosphohydrolase/phosphomutase
MMGSGSPPRLVVIALHEATLDLVTRWTADGSLPVFRGVIESGLSGRLWSRFPLFAPERWGNLVTGQSADQHGLTEFLHREQGDFMPIRFGHRHGLEADPIWRILSRRGERCILVNAPVAYPEDVAGGVVMQELLDAYAWRRESDETWRRRMSAPAELYDQVQARFGPAEELVHNLDKGPLIARLEAQVERQFRVLSWLLAERGDDWRFCLTRLTQVADAQHYLWGDQHSTDAANPHRDGLHRVYHAVDRGLGALLDALGPEVNVMVVSDCGAGALQAGIQLNSWLAQEGFLRPKAASGAAPATASAAGNGSTFRAVARRILPKPVYRAVGQLRRALLRPREPGPLDGSIDWSGTKAYAVGVDSGIAINLRGRESDGIVNAGTEYHAVRDAIIARLHTLVDPETGEHVVDHVRTAEELYGSRIAARAPDLSVEWHGAKYLPAEIEDGSGAVFTSHRLQGKVLPTTGGHRPDGLLLGKGPGSPVSQRPEGSVFDLVPTCLRLLDQPVPPGLRGKSLVE